MAWLIESYLNEGLLDRFKKKKEEEKLFCTAEQYEKYIKADAKKAFDEYIKILKNAIAKNKVSKVKFSHSEAPLKKSTDKFFVIQKFDTDSTVDTMIYDGTIALFYFDVYVYSEAIGIPVRTMEWTDIEPVTKPITDALEAYKCKISGVSFGGLDTGADWDDYIYLLKFSKEFFTSRIKDQ